MFDLSSTPAPGGSASARGSARQRSDGRDPRATVECPDGRIRRIGSAYSKQDIATLRLLIERHCTTQDIARHFNVTDAAIKMLMHRHGIKRPRPTVAEVLASLAPSPQRGEGREPAPDLIRGEGAPYVTNPPHPNPLPGGEREPVPVVDLLDDRSRYLCRVELHEIDERHQCRVRRVTGPLDRPGAAGQWATYPLHRLAIPLAQRPAILEAARARHAATLERRAALHPTPSPQRGEGRDEGASEEQGV